MLDRNSGRLWLLDIQRSEGPVVWSIILGNEEEKGMFSDIGNITQMGITEDFVVN